MAQRVDVLVEGVPPAAGRGFGPQIRLDALPLQTVLASERHKRHEGQRPLLLRRYGNGTRVTPQGERSEELEEQHLNSGSSSEFFLRIF